MRHRLRYLVRPACWLLACLLLVAHATAAESFRPLEGREPPQNLGELWDGYDPTAVGG